MRRVLVNKYFQLIEILHKFCVGYTEQPAGFLLANFALFGIDTFIAYNKVPYGSYA